jgi:sugar phosphate isomerase/epimerase
VRLGLSEISTIGASFAEDVAAYAAAGFDAIGIWEFKLPEDDDANLALLRAHGLRVANCIPAVPSVLQLAVQGMEGPADPEERVESLCASVRRFAAYEPECVACLPGVLGARTEDEGRAVLVDGIRRVAAAARAAGVRVGFEPIHPSQHDVAGFVGSLAAADAVLAEAGTPDVGILLDVYHVWPDPDVLTWIGANRHRIAGVHLSDWPSLDRTDRVLPGQGISGTGALVEALVAAGWDGTLDVEIFSTADAFWALPVDEAARQAYAAVAALATASHYTLP